MLFEYSKEAKNGLTRIKDDVTNNITKYEKTSNKIKIPINIL